MPRNIEIKLAVESIDTLLPRALALADPPAEEPTLIEQDDVFYPLPPGRGRLKLRRFADGSGELIHYRRSDDAALRGSDYSRVAVPDPEALHAALSAALGELGRVHKRRWLVLAGATRIHLDRVQGLGDFVELEVVLAPGQGDADGERRAQAVLAALGLAGRPASAGAYLDLLRASAQQNFTPG